MAPPITIRPAATADLQAIGRLLDDVDEQHRAALPWLLRQPTEPRAMEWISEFISDDARLAVVAEEEGVVGVLLAFLREAASVPVVRPARIAEVDTMIVHRKFRRRGIGTALVRAATEWAERSNAARLELGVYAFNRDAQEFWQSVGFEPLSLRLRKPLGEAT